MSVQQVGKRCLAGGEEAARLARKGNISELVPPQAAAEQAEAAGFVMKEAASAAVKGNFLETVLPPQVAALGLASGERGPGEQEEEEEEEETGASMFLAPALEMEAEMVVVTAVAEAVPVVGGQGSRMRSALV